MRRAGLSKASLQKKKTISGNYDEKNYFPKSGLREAKRRKMIPVE
jgi:hypothetical protein